MKWWKGWRMRGAQFTYVTAHFPTLPSLYLPDISFSNPSVASPTSKLILKPFFRFPYVTGSSLTSPGEPPMVFSDTYTPSLAWPLLTYSNSTIVSSLSSLLPQRASFVCLKLQYLTVYRKCWGRGKNTWKPRKSNDRDSNWRVFTVCVCEIQYEALH